MCAISVGVAALGCCIHGTSAQDTDDIDDDDDIEIAEPQRPAWQNFLAPVLSGTDGLDFLTGGMPDRLIYFTGFDIWRYGLGGYTGFQWAPMGIYKDGFILRASISNNIERYTTRTHRYVTDIARSSLMAGLKFSRHHAEIQFLVGFEGQADFLQVDGDLAARRARLGTRFTTDVWWEPTEVLMLQASLSGTTIDNAISGRAAAGWRLDDRFWIGPEASRSSDYFSTQTRFGVHLTGLRAGNYEWSIAAGHIADSFDRDGVYARVSVVLRPQRPVFYEN
jgi:hypothetical protein